jgi:CubicO group peptidase (beta-lactamase class C family)
MRRIILSLAVAAGLLVAGPLRGVEGADELLFDRVRAYMDALRAQAGIPGIAATIVGRTDVLWEYAAGMQDVERAVPMRPDTPIQIDGLTQTVTATMLLRCVEEGRFSIDDPLSLFMPDAPEPDATIRQLLSHTSGPPEGLVFTYRPDRLAPLLWPEAVCATQRYRYELGGLLDRLAMSDSVPGPDAVQTSRNNAERAQYTTTLSRLSRAYSVDKRSRPTPITHPVTALTTYAGLISSVRDLAKFDLALRKGVLVRDDTLAGAWRTSTGLNRLALPHGLGWFVQSYNGEPVVWQFGVTENASSSLMITLPARGTTFIVVANSDGLAKPYPLALGDVTVSPFARVFLSLFTRG